MLSTKKLLYKMLNNLDTNIVEKDYSYSYTNLGANTSLTITAEQMGFSTPTGYTPIGIVTVESGHVAVEIERMSAYLGQRIRNVSSSAQSGTYAMRVAYAKNVKTL